MLIEIRIKLINLKIEKLKKRRSALIDNNMPTLFISGEILNLIDKKMWLIEEYEYYRKG